MNKTFALPQQIIDCLRHYAPADRGEAFTTIFDYANHGIEPDDSISPAARGAFEFARLIIDPILERRRKAAERRKARKEQAEDAPPQESPVVQSIPPTEAASADAVPPEHIRMMKKVVDLAHRTCSTKAKRDEKIQSELHRRYPGVYAGIEYDKAGNVILCPAS